MKLLWSPRSPFVRKVMFAAEELGVREQLELVRCLVPTTDPDHIVFQFNPLGSIPVLIPGDGPPLIGSGQIIEYLDELAAPQRLHPQTRLERHQALQLQVLADGMLDQLVPWQALIRKGVPAHQEGFIIRAEIKLAKILEALEGQAEQLHQEKINVGHIAVAVMLSYLDFRHRWTNWRATAPSLALWYETISRSPRFCASEFVDETRLDT